MSNLPRYKYKDRLFTYKQLEAIAKQHHNKKGRWKENLALMTKFPAEESIERSCLKCDRKFTARTKYERICERCKGSEEWIDAELTLL
jgi:hypothetical protein